LVFSAEAAAFCGEPELNRGSFPKIVRHGLENGSIAHKLSGYEQKLFELIRKSKDIPFELMKAEAIHLPLAAEELATIRVAILQDLVQLREQYSDNEVIVKSIGEILDTADKTFSQVKFDALKFRVAPNLVQTEMLIIQKEFHEIHNFLFGNLHGVMMEAFILSILPGAKAMRETYDSLDEKSVLSEKGKKGEIDVRFIHKGATAVAQVKFNGRPFESRTNQTEEMLKQARFMAKQITKINGSRNGHHISMHAILIGGATRPVQLELESLGIIVHVTNGYEPKDTYRPETLSDRLP